MSKGFSIDSLDDIKGLKRKLGQELMWGLHGRTDHELREKTLDEDVELSDQERRFSKKLLNLVEAADSTEHLSQLLDDIPMIDDSLEGEEIEFRNFVEQRTRETYREEIAENYDEETLENLAEISRFSWSDLNNSLMRSEDLGPEANYYMNLMSSWSEKLKPEQISELLSDQYVGLSKGMRSSHQEGEVQAFENAVSTVVENENKVYGNVLEQVEELGFEEGAQYLNELELLAESEYDESSLDYEQEVLEEILVLVDEAENHYQLAADTDNMISTLKNKYRGKARLMEDTVNKLYSKALEDPKNQTGKNK